MNERTLQQVMDGAEEQNIILLPLIIPVPFFKILSDAAVQAGKPVEMIMTEALQEKVEKIKKQKGL